MNLRHLQNSLLFLLLSCSMFSCRPKLPPSHQAGVQKAIAYVEGCRSADGKIPRREQFMAWLKTADASGVADYDITSVNGREEYRISVWAGEQMIVYSSTTKSLDRIK